MSVAGLLVGFSVLMAMLGPTLLLMLTIETNFDGRSSILVVSMSAWLYGISFIVFDPLLLSEHYDYSFFAFLIGLALLVLLGTAALVDRILNRRRTHPTTQSESATKPMIGGGNESHPWDSGYYKH